MPSYQFRLSKSDGTLSLMHVEMLVNDDVAGDVARRISTSAEPAHWRIEIWRDDERIYDGAPGGWQPRFADASTDSPHE